MTFIIVGFVCLALLSTAIIYYKTKKYQCALITLGVSVLIPTIILYIMYGSYYRSVSYYREFWNNHVVKVTYYQAWDEKVSCRHPKYCTRLVTKTGTRTDSNGRTSTYTYTVTETYQCGWLHAYDVDFHPEYWDGDLDNGGDISISKGSYNFYKDLWKNNTFIDLNRHYHSIDGDKYESKWNNELLTIFPYITIHSYKNKIRACPSIFGFTSISKELQDKFKSPAEINNTHVVYNFDTKLNINFADEYLTKINASLGSKYQIHNIILLFNSKLYDQDIINIIRSAWKGPNKNELVTLIGVNADNEIEWCQLMSWSDDTTIHAKIRQDILDLRKFSDVKICNSILDNVKKYWKRKHFADFEFMKVEIPGWIFISGVVSSLITNIVLVIIMFIKGNEMFIQRNGFTYNRIRRYY